MLRPFTIHFKEARRGLLNNLHIPVRQSILIHSTDRRNPFASSVGMWTAMTKVQNSSMDARSHITDLYAFQKPGDPHKTIRRSLLWISIRTRR
jgi:hypothetical protein